ncbi:peptidylprolyl isomerase [Thiorhodovibrio frisius]|uniref:Chaperone SurA n=1 Tax=Thiorhodovibrio frisius TaxID=631362 RepID=H8Z7E8_9GAMM|nr:peptidylprolyl isomerase [Thiorhodovibrio frisius]EIC20878.1 parvulin-like peptidyl-prolyl isomerase [Thiorhodovibrio frisius]WPL21933.1 Peptidyl-prolyl cis-trans isomerase SurA [Thiorhodovibrio frisius]
MHQFGTFNLGQPILPPTFVRQFLLLLAIGLFQTPALAATIQPLDGIVAVVNEDVIVQSEIENEIDLLMPQLQQSGAAIPPRPELEQQVLERLILKRLQVQRAKMLGIEVDDATLTQAMENIAARNGMALDELQLTLESSGVDFNDFREDTRMQILTSRLQAQEVAGNIRVSEPEIDRFLATESDSLLERREVRLQHILVALPDEASPEDIRAAEQKTQSLLKRLRAGEDFSRIAAANSDGRNAADGGDLGWFAMADVPVLVAAPARQLDKGEVSGPIRSPSGFHLIKVTDIKGDDPEPITQTHARHILIRTNELVSDADAKRRLSQLRMRIVGGDSFETLARANSDDTGSALKGGDLGWIGPGDTVPEFEKTMNSLAPNDISQPFQSSFGWHIVQVLERRKQDTREDLLRMKAVEAIRARKAQDATEIWLRRLRDEAFVEVRLEQPEPDDTDNAN